jgi:glycosyltransferase involved in cell wall biosynthesis
MYSVIIPTYNRCTLLSEAIDSVLQQSYPSIEIIVIDDGSNDSTAEMVSEKYPQVDYYYQSNQGPAAARNRGIRESTGNLVAFLDSDDIWLENKIKLELMLLRAFPGADVLAGNSSAFVEGQLRSASTFSQRRITFNRHQPRFFDWSISIMKLGPVCCTSAMTFKRPTLLQLGSNILDESLRFDEDWDLEFRIFSQFKVLLYPQVVCSSRVFDDGTRQYYSAEGRQKSSHEQRHIWQQQKGIIEGYLNNPHRDRATESGFRQRRQQLAQLLSQ